MSHTSSTHLAAFVKPFERPLTRGMKVAAWTTLAYAGFEVMVLPMMVRRTAAGWHFTGSTALHVGLTIIWATLMFRGLVVSYYGMGLYGMWRLLLAAVALGAVVTGMAERLGDIWVLGMLVATPFAIGWIIGLIAVRRAGRQVGDSEAVARAV
jgi:hypothetical protein